MPRRRVPAAALALAVVASGEAAGLGPVQPWRELRAPGVVARFAPRDSARAAAALVVLSSFERLPALRAAPPPVRLVVAPTRGAMDSLAGGRVPEWAAAMALPDRMEIVIPGALAGPAPASGQARILRHEWAHLMLAHELEGRRVPRWFAEGYAEWAVGGWLDHGSLRLGLALALGAAPPLDSLALAWPRTGPGAELAYLLSASAVEYLVASSGVVGLEAMLARWRQGGSFDEALRATYGATPSQLEADWRRWVKRRYGWAVVVSHSAPFWVLLGAAALALAWSRRRRDRERMARLRARDPPDAPAYWSERAAAGLTRTGACR